MTDREIMLSAEQRIDELMNKMLGSDPVSKKQVLQELKAVKESVHQVTTSTIDYQIVVDNLDDNILIADASETILYVNKAYQKSSGIPKENLIGKTVSHIAETTDYFTVTTVPDVIQKKEPVMKLSYLPGQKNPSIVVGMPIFYSNGELQYIIATNRELSTYTNLRDNYNTFLNLLSDMKSAKNAVQVIQETFTLSEKQMIGEGKEMTQIRKFISNVASTDATVLVTGESGTGKELIADAIYTASKRNNMPFIKINCAAIPSTLVESELFGYETGTFSGAIKGGKAGKFEQANHGTILLDEIEELPLEAQSKLLRVLQEYEVERIGSVQPIPLDIHVICCSNQDLYQMVKEKKFREDLLYRINVIELEIPPLRDRMEDIPLLCQSLIHRINEKYHLQIKNVSKSALQYLSTYSWPGNVRELGHAIERACIMSDSTTLTKQDFDFLKKKFHIQQIHENALSTDSTLTASASTASSASSVMPSESNSLFSKKEEYEKQEIQNALKKCAGNKTKAAKELGISRSLLYDKIAKYGIN